MLPTRRALVVASLAALTPLFRLPAQGATRDVAAARSDGGVYSTMFRGDLAHTGVSRAKLFAGQGGVRWRVQTGSAVRSTPAVTATRLYIGSGDGGLYAIDRASGKVAWKFDAGGSVDASPAVAGGMVIAATLPGRIFAVDEGTGRLRWSIRTGALLPLNIPTPGGWDMYASSPAVSGETVVIGAGDGGIYALDLRSGKQKWRVQTRGRVRATPAIANGAVVVGSFDGRVYAVDLATGAERWVFRTNGDTLDSVKWGFDRRSVQSSAAIAEGMAFVGSRDGSLYGVDAATGERRWRATHRGSWVVGSPAVREGKVYVGSSDGHFIHAVEAQTGKDVWRLETGANVISSPLLVGDALVVGTMRTSAAVGDLLALDAATGTERWRLRLDEAILSSPVAADGELYVGTEGGSVYAVHEASPVVPRLAVFYDSTLTNELSAAGGPLAFAYFRELGYEPLGSASLARFMGDRIADGVPSAVVFAIDALPRSVAPVAADTVLFRRYLNAGGKVVWLGGPVAWEVFDSTGKLAATDLTRGEKLIGVSSATRDWDENPARTTEAGRRWGLGGWVRGRFPLDTSAVSQTLAVDEQLHKASAWVQLFRPDRPGSGFVQLWGFGASVERLPAIRAAAEYGLLRR
ncbi:MAG TPA: PQQ-binding-like beta-propeller repeat protein [Gemmatimonadaceae bacterium]|nr:PQQ-binding-like beta-propeller repeat protein [Gemmatimonadaceae bacterium]